MRRLMMAAVMAAGLTGTGLVFGPQAQAMPLPGAGGFDFAKTSAIAEKVALVCPRPRWNGFAWVQPPCYHTYPMVAPAPLYGPPVVVMRRPYRRPRRVIVY